MYVAYRGCLKYGKPCYWYTYAYTYAEYNLNMPCIFAYLKLTKSQLWNIR